MKENKNLVIYWFQQVWVIVALFSGQVKQLQIKTMLVLT